MTAKLYTHIRETSTDDLVVIVRFFDTPRLRQYYTGLIADIRKELSARGFYAGQAVDRHDDES